MNTSLFQNAALLAALLATAAAPSPLAAALIVPVSQSRSVSVSVNLTGTPPATTNFTAAAGLGAFNRTNTLSGMARPLHPYLVQAGQSSQIGGAAITAAGVVDDEPGIASDGFANADFKVVFRLTAPASFTLAGSLTWTETTMYSTGSPAPFVRLSNAGGILFEAMVPTSDGTLFNYTTNGVLPAGEYTIEAHANSTVPLGYDQSLMNYDLAFTAVAVGPPQYAGQVYPLSGMLNGLIQGASTTLPVTVATHDLVNVALGRSLFATNVPVKQVLVLVSDTITHGVRLAVWDKTTTNVVAELGPITFQSGLVVGTNYTGIADVSLNTVGRVVDTAGGINSRLTLVAKGLSDAAGAITTFSSAPVIGQLNVIDDLGNTNLVLLKGGTLTSGRKLGTTP
jgi:hypothetical protein